MKRFNTINPINMDHLVRLETGLGESRRPVERQNPASRAFGGLIGKVRGR